MKLTYFLFLTLFAAHAVCDEEPLDDLSFEDEENRSINKTANSDIESLSEVEESESSVFPKTEAEKRELVKRVLTAGLKRPGAWSRLGQVLPIVRIMSAPQRLALASLIMAQVLAGPGEAGAGLPAGAVGAGIGAASRNLTAQLMLPISMDIATMFRGLAREQPTGRSTSHYRPQMYPGESRLRPSVRRPPPTMPGINRRNANVHPTDILVPPRRLRPHVRPLGPPPTLDPPEDSSEPRFCDAVIATFCLQSPGYPLEAIMRSMESSTSKAVFGALLKDSDHNLDPGNSVIERRYSDPGKAEGHMCGSTMEIVRPKRARATSGTWKYIVNTGEYTQTLRLELCSKPGSSCSFLAENVESQCVQIYNYHRLLTWDESNGLTMDIFKVPTCCSCHVQGYGGMHFPKADTTPRTGQDHSDINLVDDHSRVKLPPPKVKGVRVRPYVPPKRESAVPRRPGQVQHRGPPLPLEGETGQNPRFPPYDNHLRRTTRNNTADRSKFGAHPSGMIHGGGPNQRHPALPADSVQVSRFSTPPPPPPPPPSRSRPVVTPPAKKINYSYHPIIDFFRPATAESRIGLDWTPITDRPRSLE